MKPLALIACAVLLAGCSSPAPAVVTVTAPAATTSAPSATPTTATPSPIPTTDAPTTPETSERGNIPKDLGDEAVLVDGNGDEAARFKVTKIETGYQCTSDIADKSANGQFVAIWMDVRTTKAIDFDSDDSGVVPYFNTVDWEVVDKSGETENDSEGNGPYCARDADALPVQIEKAMHVKGVVVLDTAVKHGHLVFIQDYMDSGWEWDF